MASGEAPARGWDELQVAAAALAQQLRRTAQKIVFAESCTCGLVAAALGTVPGISAYLCGSAVVYRAATKIAWLGVPAARIEQDTAVAPSVTVGLAEGVLQRTLESDWGVAVTGHLGPQAPPALDGQLYLAIARRNGSQIEVVRTLDRRLTTTEREPRLFESAWWVLRMATDIMSRSEPGRG